jgi:hypothetical protein
MVTSVEIFEEKGFNSDLTGNIFDIVLFRNFHVGVCYSNLLLHFIFQNKNKTLFFNIWFSKKRAKSYLSNLRNSENYKKYVMGSYV